MIKESSRNQTKPGEKSRPPTIPQPLKKKDEVDELLERTVKLDWLNAGSQDVSRNVHSLFNVIKTKKDGREKQAAEILSNAIKSGLSLYSWTHALGDVLKFSMSENAGNTINEMMDSVLSDYGLTSKVVDHWCMSGRIEDRSDLLHRNMSKLIKLEGKNKGLARRLHETYGISCFDRYNEETLIRLGQQDNSRLEIPGIIVVSRSDMNGAAYRYARDIERLSRDFGVIIIEADSVVDMSKRVLRAHKSVGNPFDFMMILAHGEPDNMKLGPNDIYGYISSEDGEGHKANIYGEGMLRGRQRVLKKNGSLIMVSCDTGVPRGIGEKVEDQLDLTVFAIPYKGKMYAFKRFDYTVSDKHVDFDLEFDKYKPEEDEFRYYE